VKHVFHFFLPPEARGTDGAVVALCDQDARRITRVLRLAEGDPVQVADGDGRIWDAAVAGPGRVRLGSVLREPAPAPPLTVRLALAGPRSDTAVEKLVELGVERISPLDAAGTRREARIERWQRIAEAAACQARRPRVPRIESPVTLEEALHPGVVMLSHEGPDADLRTALQRAGRPVELLIGPEAGFLEAEIDAARSADVPVATLGDVVLRTETAAIAGAVLALAELGCIG
jgi:16S rRNA (uracil1498-N3)-methyltransferase